MTRVVPNGRKVTLMPIIEEKIKKGSTISSNMLAAYQSLNKRGYNHGTVDHGAEQWVNGIHYTNTIEGFWSHLKRSILGTHIHVSNKHLSKYLGEFECRYNMRSNPFLMFGRLLVSF